MNIGCGGWLGCPIVALDYKYKLKQLLEMVMDFPVVHYARVLITPPPPHRPPAPPIRISTCLSISCYYEKMHYSERTIIYGCSVLFGCRQSR